jgi:hypothetical protein
LKKSNNSEPVERASTSTSNNVAKVSDFPKRLAQLQNSNPQIFTNAAQVAKKNYK